jgi:hypothetical protein
MDLVGRQGRSEFAADCPQTGTCDHHFLNGATLTRERRGTGARHWPVRPELCASAGRSDEVASDLEISVTTIPHRLPTVGVLSAAQPPWISGFWDVSGSAAEDGVRRPIDIRLRPRLFGDRDAHQLLSVPRGPAEPAGAIVLNTADHASCVNASTSPPPCGDSCTST